MSRRLVIVAQGLDSSNEPGVPSGMVHLASAENWHRTLCGVEVPFVFGDFEEHAFIDLLATGTNAHACGPCREQQRGDS